MRLKRSILSTIAATVVLMVVVIIWHDTLFSTYYESIPYIDREEPDFTAPTIAFVIRAFLMSVIYSYIGRRASILKSGLLFGGAIGLLTGMYWVPSYYAQQPIPDVTRWFLIEGSFFIVQGMLAGMAITFVYGKSVPKRQVST